MIHLYPSLLAANPLNIKHLITLLDPYVAGYHLDVMDFHFVPNLTCGPDMINAIRNTTDRILQIHLMVDYPEKYIDRMKLKEHDIVSIHPESPSRVNLEALFSKISSYGLTPSMAISPKIPVDIILKIPSLRHILLMSVQPGFSGQKLMPEAFQKLEQVVALGHQGKVNYTIAIDGGINHNNASNLIKAGAQELIIGSALFSTNDPISALKNILSSFDPI